MTKIVISEFMDTQAVDWLSARFATVYEPSLAERPRALHAEIADAAALIVRNRTRVDDRLLAAAARLRVVGRLGVGLDNIDVRTCRAHAIEVIPATGANARSVAEYVLATAMILLRGAYFSSVAVAQGQWPRAPLCEGREIAGKTLGLVGFGNTGQAAAQLARALDVHVLATDPMLPLESPLWVQAGTHARSLNDLLAQSDVVSLHLPLTDETRGLIGAEQLARMKPDAILINTARGDLIDETALAGALRSGLLGGAALDVFGREPLPAGSPLADAPRLILTPHIAGVTRESNERVSSIVARRVAEILERSKP